MLAAETSGAGQRRTKEGSDWVSPWFGVQEVTPGP